MPTYSNIQRYLKNVDVQFISLVDSAANRREFIYKSAGDPSPDFTTQFNIVKTDAEKQLVYGIVYAPDEADTHGDAMKAEDLEKAAHNFLEKARTQNVDKQHDFQADDGVIVESYILGKSDSKFPDEKEGSWAVVIKVTDDETWEAVKKGELKGISLAGKAVAEEVEKDQGFMNEFFTKFKEFLSGNKNADPMASLMQKGFNQRMQQKIVMQAVWALTDEFHSIFDDEDIEDKKAAIDTAVNEFQDYISGLQLGGTTTKSETTMSTEKKKEEQKKSAEKEKAEEKETKEKSENNEDTEVSEKIKSLEETINKQSKRIEELEKAAPGRQSSDETDTGEEDVNKSNPKAPLSILGN